MSHSLSNTTVRQRLTQILIVIILIIAGVIFSQPAEAQTSKSKKSKITKQVTARNSNKACYQLYKKRTTTRNRSVLASASRKPKYKAMAETDPSAKVASLE
ncbi:hypothetical protein BH09BAC3_BH09BAC3_14380 [soil metagenome]